LLKSLLRIVPQPRLREHPQDLPDAGPQNHARPAGEAVVSFTLSSKQALVASFSSGQLSPSHTVESGLDDGRE